MKYRFTTPPSLLPLAGELQFSADRLTHNQHPKKAQKTNESDTAGEQGRQAHEQGRALLMAVRSASSYTHTTKADTARSKLATACRPPAQPYPQYEVVVEIVCNNVTYE